MSVRTGDGENMGRRLFPATIAEVSDTGRVVINRGSSHGVQTGQTFVIYTLSEGEVRDPVTGESLGRLERVKATGTVVNVQEKMATIELEGAGLSRGRRVGRRSLFQPLAGAEREAPGHADEAEVHGHPEIGDRAKPLL